MVKLGLKSRAAPTPSVQNDAQTLEVIPNVGLPPLYFGMARADVQATMGPPDRDEGRLAYHGLVAITYDESGFIEAFSVKSDPSGPQPFYEGHALFQLPADQVVEILARKASPTWEDGRQVATFFDLGLQLWRSGLAGDGSADPGQPPGGDCWEVVTLATPGVLEASRDLRGGAGR